MAEPPRSPGIRLSWENSIIYFVTIWVKDRRQARYDSRVGNNETRLWARDGIRHHAVSGAETVDVVAESIELVRRYTDHGALMKWDYELEDPHLDARGFRARELTSGHGRIGLLRDRQESAAQLRGNQERPRAFQRRAFLQRSRAPGIFDARMHNPSADRRAGQSRRAHPGGMRASSKSKIAARTTRSGSTRTTPILSATATVVTTTI